MCWVHRVTYRACFRAQPYAFPLRLHPPSVTTSSDPPSALLLLRVPSPRSLCPARLLLRATCPFGPGSPASGFRPSSRHHVHAATHARGSQPHAMLRPQAFAASRRFAPHARSQACFIPLPRPGFSSFKDFSRRTATLSRRQEPAPVPFLRAPLARLAPASTAHERRLRGFYPCEDAFARTQLFTKFEAASFFEFRSSRSSVLASATGLPSSFHS
jgi:hypothetical protein